MQNWYDFWPCKKDNLKTIEWDKALSGFMGLLKRHWFWWLFENVVEIVDRQMQNVNDVHRSYFCFFFLLASTQAWWLQVVCQARESTKGGRLYSFRRKFIFKTILQKCTKQKTKSVQKMGGTKLQTNVKSVFFKNADLQNTLITKGLG